MGRTLEINIPMFIGIILLIAAITAMLVFGTNKVRDLMNVVIVMTRVPID